MDEYVLSFKPAIPYFGAHDPSAAIFENGKLGFAVEEERYTRQKHAEGEFPKRAIQACLDYYDIELEDVDKVILPYKPQLRNKIFRHDLERKLLVEDHSPLKKAGLPFVIAKRHFSRRFLPLDGVRYHLSEIGSPLPPIETRAHHACHAASAFHPSGFSDALVLTLDGRGEYDSSVVWSGTEDGLERIETYEFPNSLGHFFGTVTEYLGYRAFNGEGKIMGLAPYGEYNDVIASKLRSVIETGADYDVTTITEGGMNEGVDRLERLFDRERNETKGSFDQWQKDLAHVTQALLEEIVVAMVEEYITDVESNQVALAGGVALNCKLNKRIMELDVTDEIFIQPVAHDGGLALGAGWVDQRPADVDRHSIYLGPEFESAEIEPMLEMNKLEYRRLEDPSRYAAEHIADGNLVGWFQGRLEAGPRALGNRSILADPRTESSRDRVNEFVKHREKWRPFAPSMLEEAASEYLVNAEEAPYMIKTFDTREENREEIAAVIHPGDGTTRPQTVREDQNPRYYRLIEEFGEITGVPVVLNTSFNDHAEPIVTTPKDALKDFYGMGLDVLVLGDIALEKQHVRDGNAAASAGETVAASDTSS